MREAARALRRAAAWGLLAAAVQAAAQSAAQGSGDGLGLRIAKLEMGAELAEIELDVDLAPHDRLRDAVAGGAEIGYLLELKFMKIGILSDDVLEGYSWRAAVRKGGIGQLLLCRGFGSETWLEAAGFDEAVELMREVRIEIDDAALLRSVKHDPDAYLALRVEVVLEDLPPPLQVDLLTSADWSFSSGWLQVRP